MWANAVHCSGSTTPPSGYLHDQRRQDATPERTDARPCPAGEQSQRSLRLHVLRRQRAKPIAEDIDYRIYKQLMTPFGGATHHGHRRFIGSGDYDSMTTVVDETKF